MSDKLLHDISEIYDTGAIAFSNTDYKECGINRAILKKYKYVTLCSVVSNNDNRNVTSITVPVSALYSGMEFEAPFTTDGSLVAFMYYNQSTDKLMIATGTGLWKVRVILSR